MASVSSLKDRARKEEQRGNWSRAADLYREALRRADEQGDLMRELGLYNRIGDLHLRLKDTGKAVASYLEATERYEAEGLQAPAVALCNKILRVAPDQDEVRLRLMRLHLSSGLVADARQVVVDYVRRADRAEREGDALEALLEFVAASGDEALRIEAAERLAEAGRRDEAVQDLVQLRQERQARGELAGDVETRLRRLAPELVSGSSEVVEEAEAETPMAVEAAETEPAAVEEPPAPEMRPASEEEAAETEPRPRARRRKRPAVRPGRGKSRARGEEPSKTVPEPEVDEERPVAAPPASTPDDEPLVAAGTAPTGDAEKLVSDEPELVGEPERVAKRAPVAEPEPRTPRYRRELPSKLPPLAALRAVRVAIAPALPATALFGRRDSLAADSVAASPGSFTLATPSDVARGPAAEGAISDGAGQQPNGARSLAGTARNLLGSASDRRAASVELEGTVGVSRWPELTAHLANPGAVEVERMHPTEPRTAFVRVLLPQIAEPDLGTVRPAAGRGASYAELVGSYVPRGASFVDTSGLDPYLPAFVTGQGGATRADVVAAALSELVAAGDGPGAVTLARAGSETSESRPREVDSVAVASGGSVPATGIAATDLAVAIPGPAAPTDGAGAPVPTLEILRVGWSRAAVAEPDEEAREPEKRSGGVLRGLRLLKGLRHTSDEVEGRESSGPSARVAHPRGEVPGLALVLPALEASAPGSGAPVATRFEAQKAEPGRFALIGSAEGLLAEAGDLIAVRAPWEAEIDAGTNGAVAAPAEPERDVGEPPAPPTDASWPASETIFELESVEEVGTVEQSSEIESVADAEEAKASELAHEPEAEVKPEAVAEPETAVEPEAEVEAEAEVESEAAAEPEMAAEPEAEVEPEAVAESEASAVLDSPAAGEVEAAEAVETVQDVEPAQDAVQREERAEAKAAAEPAELADDESTETELADEPSSETARDVDEAESEPSPPAKRLTDVLRKRWTSQEEGVPTRAPEPSPAETPEPDSDAPEGAEEETAFSAAASYLSPAGERDEDFPDLTGMLENLGWLGGAEEEGEGSDGSDAPPQEEIAHPSPWKSTATPSSPPKAESPAVDNGDSVVDEDVPNLTNMLQSMGWLSTGSGDGEPDAAEPDEDASAEDRASDSTESER